MHLKTNVVRALAEANERRLAEANAQLVQSLRDDALLPPPEKPAPVIAPIELPMPAPVEPESSLSYAAPVSRGDGGLGSGHYSAGSRRITLSKEEYEIAKLSGLSAQEYALGKLELQRRKQDDPLRYAG